MLQGIEKKIFLFLIASPVALLVNISPSKAFVVDFSSNPTLTSGTALTAGAEYTYSGVATDNGITIDAILTIDGLQNSASLVNVDVNDQGFSENLQPQLSGPDQATTLGNEPRAEFTLTFLNQADSNPVLLDGLTVQAFDVDGDGNVIQEGVRFYDAETATGGSAISMTTGSNSRGSYDQGLSSSVNTNPGIGNEPSNLVSSTYADGSNSFQFDYLYSSSGTGGALPRFNSLYLEAASATAVPFKFSPTLGLVVSIIGISGYQLLVSRR